VIHFPEFAINAIAPEDLPSWIAEEEWRAATFVEVNIPSYWTSERVYEYTAEDERNVVPYRYLTGLISDPPNEVFEKIDPGFRGEYALDMNGPARLYFSPVDRRLHLLGATAGIWNLGEGRELRYGSLGTAHIRRWTLTDGGRIEAELYLANDHLVYASSDGVSIGELEESNVPDLLTPPRNHEEWVAMGELVREQGADQFEPDDLETMFGQAVLSVRSVPEASVSDVRLTQAGFEVVMDLPRVPRNADWLAGRRPGTYVISYREGEGFSARRARPATIEVSAPIPVGEPALAGTETTLAINVRNLGDIDDTGVRVTAYAGRSSAQMQPIGSTRVDVPAGESREARIAWLPSASGEWLVQARIVASAVTGPVSDLDVHDMPGDGMLGVFDVQDLSPGWPVLAVVLVVAAALLAVRVGSALAARDSARRVGDWPSA
jgi:hypothetical protein